MATLSYSGMTRHITLLWYGRYFLFFDQCLQVTGGRESTKCCLKMVPLSTLTPVHKWQGKIHSMISKWFKIFPLLLEGNEWSFIIIQWIILIQNRDELLVWLMVSLKFLTLVYNSVINMECNRLVAWLTIKCNTYVDIRSDHSYHYID